MLVCLCSSALGYNVTPLCEPATSMLHRGLGWWGMVGPLRVQHLLRENSKLAQDFGLPLSVLF